MTLTTLHLISDAWCLVKGMFTSTLSVTEASRSVLLLQVGESMYMEPRSSVVTIPDPRDAGKMASTSVQLL